MKFGTKEFIKAKYYNMPIKIKTDLEFGQSIYLKNDCEQLEHSLVSVIVLPGNAVKFRLSYQGDICEVYDFEASTEIDKVKMLSSDKGGTGD